MMVLRSDWDPFLRSFDSAFPYAPQHDDPGGRVILESLEGIRFHIPIDMLTQSSSVFADASTLVTGDYGYLRPIVLTFAPCVALKYFLEALRDEECDVHAQMVGRRRTTIDAIRIAHILDAPVFGKILTRRANLDAYLLYVIERVLESPSPAQTTSKPSVSHDTQTCDLSFSLNPIREYQRSFSLLQELNPSAIQSLKDFHHNRRDTMVVTRLWLSTGKRLRKGVRGDRTIRCNPQNAKKCTKHPESEIAFGHRLLEAAPQGMVVLAQSKTRKERKTGIRDLLDTEAKGCRGCAARFRSVYDPALRFFDANFPATPSW